MNRRDIIKSAGLGGAAEHRGGARRGDAAAEHGAGIARWQCSSLISDNTICPPSPPLSSGTATIVAAGAVGTRRVGTNIPVGIDDRFHIGSDTKAMTALLAAMLVEEGKLRWDTHGRGNLPRAGRQDGAAGRFDPPRSAPVAYQRHSQRQRRAGQAGDGFLLADRAEPRRDAVLDRRAARRDAAAIGARRALCLCEHGVRAGRRDRRAPLRLDLGATGRDAHFRPARA